jgi:hypothetical protein
MVARSLVVVISMPFPTLGEIGKISKPFRSSVTPAALIWMPFVLAVGRLAER